MDAIRDAGDALVDVSLTTIARLARAQGGRLIDRGASDATPAAERGKMVILYGGSIHNDLAPSPETARWSYAPALDAQAERAGGHLMAVDLVVPEFIGQDDVWRALPWWSSYDVDRLGSKATLFRTGPRSFVLVFPRGRGGRG
jgi:hypothetical protein